MIHSITIFHAIKARAAREQFRTCVRIGALCSRRTPLGIEAQQQRAKMPNQNYGVTWSHLCTPQEGVFISPKHFQLWGSHQREAVEDRGLTRATSDLTTDWQISSMSVFLFGHYVCFISINNRHAKYLLIFSIFLPPKKWNHHQWWMGINSYESRSILVIVMSRWTALKEIIPKCRFKLKLA